MSIILDTRVANCIVIQVETEVSVQTSAIFKGLVGLWTLLQDLPCYRPLEYS